MAEKIFDQNFSGYWLEASISSFPDKSGVYGVYRCIYNKQIDTVTLIELIYIGKADNLNNRINKHKDWPIWKGTLKNKEEICFCYTYVDKLYNERVEAALINSNQPRLNIEYKNSFPFDKTTVKCNGPHKFIKRINIVIKH
ncbi:MAG: GIY-YIG nuclease family protein [Fulvivirga sp.]|uniref:hypothetical protein n=1 Tax=Fulvivirga sp. TaxID=1931237 RepID=UPI0032ED1E4F